MTINGRHINDPLDLLIAGPILIMTGLFLISIGLIVSSPFWIPVILLCFAI